MGHSTAGLGDKSLLALCLLLGVSASGYSTEPVIPLSQRLRPPAQLGCSRDRLTSFQGRILEYKRGPQDISLRVRTDEDTTESFNLKWQTSEKADAWFLLKGEPFKATNWKEIESAPGKLQDGMRVIVWVCDDGSKPVFDWRPKES